MKRAQVVEKCLKYFEDDQLATDVVIDKYLMKKKGDSEEFLESDPGELLARMRQEFARIEQKYPNPLTEAELALINFGCIVPQGSVLYGLGNDQVLTSVSNCVVIASPEDNLSSIMDSAKDLANLFKRRAGVGLDLSELRPEGAPVNNSAGTSTGAWSFADLFSSVTRKIGQSGRRGALMLTMDIRHPDIEKFITCKLDKSKVTGANISVRVNDDFMEAVSSDSDFNLCFPVDSQNVVRTVKAKDIWSLIAETNRVSAEPGIIFWDTITRELPANEYSQFKTICTNPCSEIALSAFDSCRLISLNLSNFVIDPFEDSCKFDFVQFKNAARVMTRLGDDLVDLEIEKLDQIIAKTDEESEKELWLKLKTNGYLGRRIGLGTHGLADALAKLRIKYDTEEALSFCNWLYEAFRNSVYECSCDLAEQRSVFPCFEAEKHLNNEFIKRLPGELRSRIEKVGLRNISLLTQAPTGSISIVSQTSSGMEPVFSNGYIRRKKKNHNSKPNESDFLDQNGDRWEEYRVYHKNIEKYRQKHDGDLPDFFVEAHNIDWRYRIKLQGAIQKFIDHSISSTINLPVGTDAGTISSIYMEAWKNGLKGVTIYVEGSRTGVLVSEPKEEKFAPKDAVKRPKELNCDIHTVSVKGEKYTIFVGLLDDEPYEVMGGKSEFIEIPEKVSKGKIVKYHKGKESSARYDLVIDDLKICNLTKIFDNKNNEVLTRMISLSLRHGASPSFLVEQLGKDPESDFFSFSRGISRVLKKYIKDGTKVLTDKTCPSCGSEGLRYVEGCATCHSCGFSKCS